MKPQFNIKRWRQAHGINQKWLGFLMGLPQPNMNRIENGARGFTRVQFHLFLAVKVIIENGLLQKYKDAIMDATYEEDDYAQFWTNEEAASQRNPFKAKRTVKNPFTGHVVDVDG